MPSLHDVIAIDGPAASGKSTVAERVADRLDAIYISTGQMYRAVTWLIVRRGLDPEEDGVGIAALLATSELQWKLDREGRPRLLLDDREVPAAELRAPDVTGQVSAVAKLGIVRDWLRERQRACTHLGRLVMEGRDIGTVIFPDAAYKFFITATARERARRRLAQKDENVTGATLDSVTAAIEERDRLDSTREIAPLRAAEDAHRIDTTELTIEQVVDRIVALVGAT